MKEKENLSYQLGYYVGEYIVYRYLPTISCEDMGLRPIQVTDEEKKEYDKLSDVWFHKRYSDKKTKGEIEWQDYQKYRRKLIEKYIPEKLDCHLPLLDIDNLEMESFKDGVGTALWQSDMSYYKCEASNIEYKEEPYGKIGNSFKKIILTRS